MQRELGSATLTIAVLILFFGLVLTALLWLVLAGLTTLLAGLTALLSLSGLVTLLTLLLHIVCHKNILLKKARARRSFEIEALSINLVAARDCKGWERIPAASIAI